MRSQNSSRTMQADEDEIDHDSDLDRHIYDSQLKAKISRELLRLKPNEEFIIRARFGIDAEKMTYREIGNALGVSQYQTKDIEREAIRKLQRRFAEDMPKNTGVNFIYLRMRDLFYAHNIVNRIIAFTADEDAERLKYPRDLLPGREHLLVGSIRKDGLVYVGKELSDKFLVAATSIANKTGFNPSGFIANAYRYGF